MGYREEDRLYIGIMSGTSLDAIDVALCLDSSTKFTLESRVSYPLDGGLKRDILRLIESKVSIREVGAIDYRLGVEFSRAVKKLLIKSGTKASDIEAIGSHGQTVWHEPRGEYPFTMQLGNPSVLAVESGIDVVADFRSKDVALGGEGAPFAPIFHKELFKFENLGCMILVGYSTLKQFFPQTEGG